MSAHDRVLHVRRAPLVDVLDPLVVVLEAVGGDADELHVALREVRGPVIQCPWSGIALCFANSTNLPPRDLSELGRADGGEVTRVREEDRLPRASASQSLSKP